MSKSLFDIVFGGDTEPTVPNPLDGISKVLQTSLFISGSDSNGLSISTGTPLKRVPDEFFVISADAETTSTDNFSKADTYDDPRRKLSKEERDDLNFYIEMVDENLKAVDLPTSNPNIKLRALRLGVNPQSLSINSAKIVNRYPTLTRWVEEHWGDELDNIAIQGSTLAFILFPNQSKTGNEFGGLNVSERNLTSPYQELQQLVRIFQTNGLIYQEERDTDTKGNTQNIVVEVEGESVFDDTVVFSSHPRLGMIKERLYVKLSYDYGIFIGYFESFDVVEDASSPYRMTYSINFKAEKTVWK